MFDEKDMVFSIEHVLDSAGICLFVFHDIIYYICNMIYYYSATGNTRFATEFIARILKTEIFDILQVEDEGKEKIPEDESVGFMFPIYCWGIPPVMKNFIERTTARLGKAGYIWGLCTCGDEAGIAMKQLDRIIKKNAGKPASALFSLIMPNTYVLLPGFDVDNAKVEETKLNDAPRRLELIAGKLEKRVQGIYDVHEGSLPSLRTKILYPLFNKWGVNPKKWKVAPSCISCGKCAAICPAHNIKMNEMKPVWGCNCYSCCACFHVCPVKAVSYGGITKNKSQYICPLK